MKDKAAIVAGIFIKVKYMGEVVINITMEEVVANIAMEVEVIKITVVVVCW